MSVNIQNGFLFKDKDIYEINKHLTELKPKLRSMAREKFSKIQAEAVVLGVLNILYGIKVRSPLIEIHHTDFAAYKGNNLFDLIYYVQKLYAIRANRNLVCEPGDPYYSDINVSCKVGIFPLKDKMLGIFFCQGFDAFQHFMAQPWVSDYAYWDSTDPDDKVSPEEWAKRCADWDEALPSIGVPKEYGIFRELVSLNDAVLSYVTIEEVIQWLDNASEEVTETLEGNEISKEDLIQKILEYGGNPSSYKFNVGG